MKGNDSGLRESSITTIRLHPMIVSFIATGLVSLQITILTLLLAFTTRSSLFRPGALPLMIFLTYFQLPYVKNIDYPLYRAFLGATGVYVIIIYIDTILLHKWTFEAKGPTSSMGGLNLVEYGASGKAKRHRSGIIADALERLRFGLSITLQSRFPATKWPVKNIPSFSRKDPGYVPGRNEFLRGMIIKWSAYVLILDLVSLVSNDADNTLTFSSARIPFFTRLVDVSGEEISTRIISIIAYWTIQYIVIEVVSGTLAIAAVILGITEVNVWPPVFGSLGDSYSLRQFWGCFYHQLIRRGCSSIAYFITYSSLHLQKGGLIGRYLFIFLTFTVSGLFHAFSDITQRIPWQESGAIQFFCMQTLGIMLEDAIQALFRSYRGEKGGASPWAARALGYLWVVAWMVWTTPVWTYPSMQRDKGERILPFSLMDLFSAGGRHSTSSTPTHKGPFHFDAQRATRLESELGAN